MDDLERWMRRPLTRRSVLRGAGRGSVGLSAMAALLAACGPGGEGRKAGDGTEPTPTPSALPPVAGELTVAQWPLYIDRAKGGARPTLEAFEAEHDIDVTYREIINDNQEFFAKLAPQLQAEQPTGWDLVALSDWVVTRLAGAGWIEPLHQEALPNVQENLLPAFRDPEYDPGNAHSVPWQGGITGIAYDPAKTGFPVTTFRDLWDERLAGHVGMLTEMVDTVSLTLLMLGVDPQTATIEDVERVQQELLAQREAGIVRRYYGQDYIDAVVNGDTWATMAWSGDVFYWKEWGGASGLEFVVPEEGGLIWTTPLEIPRLAEHPHDAHLFMDWFYRPEIAVQVTDWVLYMTPVNGVRELMAQKAAESKGATKRYYERLSTSPLLFPPDDLSAANLHRYKALSEEELAAYDELFQQVVQS